MSSSKVFETDVNSIVESVDWQKLDGSRVLVTGATGILGTYMMWTLLEASRRNLARLEIVGVSRSGRLRLTRGGVDQPQILSADVSGDLSSRIEGLFDFVIHAAGYGQPGKFVTDPLSSIRVNTVGLLGALRALAPTGTLAFVSSSEVYSGLAGHALAENEIGTTTPTHPRAAYIEAKRCGEAIVNSATAKEGIAGLNFRLALAYGPGAAADDSRVLYELVRKGLVDREIRLRDAGDAMRTYCYVTDAVEIMLGVIASKESGTYNVGGTSRTSIRSLAEMIGNLTGASVIVPETIDPALVGAPTDVQLDLTKALGVTGKTSFVPLEEGVGRTVQWTRGRIASGHG